MTTKLFALLALVAVLAAPAIASTQFSPTAKDRADARQYISVNIRAERAGARLANRFPELNHAASTCKIDRSKTETTFGSQLTHRLTLVTSLQFAALVVRPYSHDLTAVQAHDPHLRAFAAWVARTQLPFVLSFATTPPLDMCTVLTDWKMSGYSSHFDWAADAHVSTAQVKRAIQVDQSLSSPLQPPAKLAKQVATRLVAFGISTKQAQAFVEQT